MDAQTAFSLHLGRSEYVSHHSGETSYFRTFYNPEVLTANVVLNGLTNVATHHAALSNETRGRYAAPAYDFTGVGNYGAGAVHAQDATNLGVFPAEQDQAPQPTPF